MFKLLKALLRFARRKKSADTEIHFNVPIVLHSPTCRSHRPVCVRCLISVRDLAEVSSWTLVTVDNLDVSFPFCPRCGLSKSLTTEQNRERLDRCRKFVGWKLRATVN